MILNKTKLYKTKMIQ